MAAIRTSIRLLSYLTFLARLVEFRTTNLRSRQTKDTGSLCVLAYRQKLVKFRRQHRIKLAVQRSTKHGPVVLCLPETTFVLRPVGRENILRSGDVHPLPGPSLFQDQQRTSDPVRSNISYSPSTLRNYAISGSGFSPPCPELKRRLQNLGIFRTLNTNLARSTVKSIPIISRPRQARNGRKISNNNAARSRNLNNCVILSPGDYANSCSLPGSVSKTIEKNARPILVRITPRSTARGPGRVNRHKAVKIITTTKQITRSGQSNYSFPSFYMANARSVTKKFDELTAQLLTAHMDIAIITESWLHDQIDSNFLCIPGYNLTRRDRRDRMGGGVCAFVSSNIPFKRRPDLEPPEHECMWLWLRPHRLPCPLSGIICGIVYFPEAPAHVQKDRTTYIIETLDSVRATYPDCGVVLLGDFNTQDITDMLANHNLKQIVQKPTRGNNILDLILTNLSEHYSEPFVSAHLGSSDHGSVHWSPLSNAQFSLERVKKKRSTCAVSLSRQ